MSTIQIDEVYPKEAVYPLIVNFQNGYTNEKFKSQECVVMQNERTNKIAIATELSEMLYAGDEEEEPLGKTVIVARNKKTGKVRLIEVETVEMKPIVKSNSDVLELLETSNLELSRKFGSKKQKKIMEQREKLKINVQTVTKQMASVTDTVIEDQLDLSSYNKIDTDDFYIPPINRQATTVQEVYDIDTILTENQYSKIYAELENSNYKSHLHDFLKPLAKNLSPKHTVLLVYANSLLNLYATMMKEIYKKNFVICPDSAILDEIILSNFLTHVNGKRGRSPQYKDKCLCHAIVFILLVNNYKFDFDDLCHQLKYTPRTVVSKIALTGASIVTSGTKKLAQLKLPLNRPPLRRKSMK